MHSERCERAILSIMLFLTVFAPLAYGAVEPWAWNTIVLSIAVMTAIWVWRFVLIGRPRPAFPPFFPAGLCFLAVIAVQLVPLPKSLGNQLSPQRTARVSVRASPVRWVPLTADPAKTAAGGLFFAACLAFCFVLTNGFRYRRWVKIALTFLLVMGASEALYGLVEYWTGHQHIFWYRKIHYLEEVTGTYINHNHFAGLLGPLLILAVGTFAIRFARFVASRSYRFEEDGRSAWKKVKATAQLWRYLPASLALILAAIGAMAVALVLSQSRGGLISCGIAVGLQTALIWKMRIRPTPVMQSLGVLALLAAVLGVALAPGLLTRFSYARRDAPERFELWQDSAKIVRDYPLLGTGLGTFRDVLPNYRPQKDFFFVAGIPQPAAVNYAHNDYLQLLAECGFVGFGLMAWALIATLRHLFSRFASQTDWEISTMGFSLVASVVAFLLHSLVDFNLHIPANALVFCLLVSIALVLARDCSSGIGAAGSRSPNEF